MSAFTMLSVRLLSAIPPKLYSGSIPRFPRFR